MNNFSGKNILWIWLLFVQQIIFPQTFNPQFETIVFNQSENTGTVYCIYKDRQGFIWLGTSTGLKRFDGINIKVYRFNPADSLSISSNEVRSIQEDKNGDLWIGTINKGINKFIRREEKFIRYDKSQKGNNYLKEEVVPQLVYTSDNQLWACVWEAGLAYFDEVKNKFEYIIVDSNEISPALSKNIRSIHASKTDSNIFWVGTRQGLLKFDRKLKKYFPIYLKDIPTGSALSGFIFSIIEGKDNTLWIGSQNKGFCNYNPATEKISEYGFNKNTSVLSLTSDNYGNVWIGTAGDGVFFFDSRTKAQSNFSKNDKVIGSLPSNTINSLLVCDEGVVWVGSAGSGLSRFNKSKKKFILFNPSINQFGFNKDEYVSYIYEDDDKDIWICGGDGKVFIYDVNPDMVEPLFKERGVRPRTKIYSVISAGSHKYLIATFGEGFFIYDKKSGKTINKKIFPEYSSQLRANRVTALLKISDGRFFIGTDGAGLFEYNLNSDNLTLYSDNTPNVWSLFKDQSESIWIGTWGNGLFRLNESGKEIENFFPDSKKKHGFNSTTTVFITQDYRGNLWFATQGDGIFFLDKDKFDNPQFVNFNSSHGIPGDLIMGAAAEDEYNIWISTQAGIARYNYATKSFTDYGKQDGIEQIEFNLGAILKSSDSKMYFGSLEGAYFTNKNLHQNKKNNFNSVITDIKLFNNSIKYYNKKYPSTEYELLELDYNQNFILFEFAVLNFSEASKNLCEYKFEGIDKDWVSAEGRTFANYTNLSPGKYKFLVRGIDSDKNFSTSFASIEIIIHPPFWVTWWAYSIYFLLLLSLLYFIRYTELKRRKKKEEESLRREREEARLREAELKTKNIEQEKELEKQKIRNRIAQDLHDEIGSNLSSISLMSELIQSDQGINQESSEKIKRIHNVAKGSTQAIRDIVWLTNPSSDSLKDLIAKMKEVADNTLGKFNLNFDFPGYVKEINLTPEIKRNIFFIYKEALNNIVKHAGAKGVEIRFRVDDNTIYLSIKDDGKGFTTSLSSGGNGLKNIKSRAKELKAQLKFESSPGTGTLLELITNITQTRD